MACDVRKLVRLIVLLAFCQFPRLGIVGYDDRSMAWRACVEALQQSIPGETTVSTFFPTHNPPIQSKKPILSARRITNACHETLSFGSDMSAPGTGCPSAFEQVCRLPTSHAPGTSKRASASPPRHLSWIGDGHQSVLQ